MDRVSTFISIPMSQIAENITAYNTRLGNMTEAYINNSFTTDSIPTYGDNITTAPFENNMSATSLHPVLPSAFIAAHFGFRFLFSFLAIFGNLLTIIAVFRYESLHSNTSYLICNLAIADLIGGSLSPLVFAHQMLADKLVFIPICLVEKYLSILSGSMNVYSVLGIAVDRYIFIAHPLHYTLLVTSKRTFMAVCLTWFITVVEMAVAFAVGQHLEMGMTCKFSVFLSRMVYNNLMMPQLFTVAIVTVGFYIAIARIAHKQGKAIAALNQPYDTYAATANRQQKRIAKMMITVLGTYFGCWIPQSIASVLLNTYPSSMFFVVLEKITELMFWINTWANPIIYAWKSKDFRTAFRKLLNLPSNNVGVASFNPAVAPAVNT